MMVKSEYTIRSYPDKTFIRSRFKIVKSFRECIWGFYIFYPFNTGNLRINIKYTKNNEKEKSSFFHVRDLQVKLIKKKTLYKKLLQLPAWTGLQTNSSDTGLHEKTRQKPGCIVY